MLFDLKDQKTLSLSPNQGNEYVIPRLFLPNKPFATPRSESVSPEKVTLKMELSALTVKVVVLSKRAVTAPASSFVSITPPTVWATKTEKKFII